MITEIISIGQPLGPHSIIEAYLRVEALLPPVPVAFSKGSGLLRPSTIAQLYPRERDSMQSASCSAPHGAAGWSLRDEGMMNSKTPMAMRKTSCSASRHISGESLPQYRRLAHLKVEGNRSQPLVGILNEDDPEFCFSLWMICDGNGFRDQTWD